MKRLFTLIMLAVCSISLMAYEINESIYGFELGKSHSAIQIQKELRAKSGSFVYIDRLKERKTVVTADITYNGVRWNDSKFEVLNKKNRFYSAEFQAYYYFEQDADKVYNHVQSIYADKYGEPGEYGKGCIWNGDNGMTIILDRIYGPDNDGEYYWYVILTFIDSEGFNAAYGN